jgi:hypothetical protein
LVAESTIRSPSSNVKQEIRDSSEPEQGAQAVSEIPKVAITSEVERKQAASLAAGHSVGSNPGASDSAPTLTADTQYLELPRNAQPSTSLAERSEHGESSSVVSDFQTILKG